jgi:cation diffusion facilitator family transporter
VNASAEWPVEGRYLLRFAWLSIGAAVVTIALKSTAAWLTGSVGLLSDALESVVNLVAAVIALVALSVAARPADDEHAYGREKAEYLSAGAEGAMILIAAIAIIVTAIGRLLHPQPLEKLGIGLAVTVLASIVNLAVALVLLRAGRLHRSITIEADGRHLMTDVVTSAGVVVGVLAVGLTGWRVLDPLIAIAVAINIIVVGLRLLRRSTAGLLDRSVPKEQMAEILAVLERYRRNDVQFHALRTREAGRRTFVAFHVLVPGQWTVQRGHDLVERVEADLHVILPRVTIATHLEPLEDPASYADEGLDRRRPPPSGGPLDP